MFILIWMTKSTSEGHISLYMYLECQCSHYVILIMAHSHLPNKHACWEIGGVSFHPVQVWLPQFIVQIFLEQRSCGGWNSTILPTGSSGSGQGDHKGKLLWQWGELNWTAQSGNWTELHSLETELNCTVWKQNWIAQCVELCCRKAFHYTALICA